MTLQCTDGESAIEVATPPADVVVELRGVSKLFGPVQALREVDISIRAGEVHAVVGENGAGKSTLIGVIAGVLTTDAGRLCFGGKAVEEATPKLMRELGVTTVYQHPALAADLTVLENLQLALPDLSAPMAERVLAEVSTEQLRPSLDVRVSELSLAQHHVIEIARGVGGQPRLVIFDEPTEPFQRPEIQKLFAVIRRLRAQGVAVVYVSHRLHEVVELADRISVMRDGMVIETRLRGAMDTAQIVDLIAGRPLGQIFPPKRKNRGRVVLEIRELSGRGFSLVSLAAHAGEIVGLAGVEGEGQREFLRSAVGVGRRHSGSMAVNGIAIVGNNPGAARRAGIGFVSDDRHAEGLFLALSVRENLGIGALSQLTTRGVVDRPREAAQSRDIVERFKIRTPTIDAAVQNLSGGNQQKIVIGREMATGPTVLFVDEPTKGVDVGARSEIYQRLRELADDGLAVVIASSDGIELEGLCDRVLIFARGQVVRELTDADVTDAKITEANLTATAERSAIIARSRHTSGWHRLLSSDRFPALVLAALTVVVLVGMEIRSPYFLTGFNIQTMLSFLAVLAFISIGQMATILVGGIDLSVGAVAGFCVVLASFFTPEGAPLWMVLAGSLLVVLCCALYGLFQGVLVALFELPAIIVTLASFIGLQGVALFLRPNPTGNINDAVSDICNYPLGGVPACMVAALLAAAGLECVLRRSIVGRRLRAVGSNSLATLRLGVSNSKYVLLSFVVCGALTGVSGVLLAGKIGIGSPDTGTDYTIMSITAVVLGGVSITGGRGSIVSVLMGAALVQVISTASSFVNADSSVHYTALGFITVLAAVFFSLARRHRTAS